MSDRPFRSGLQPPADDLPGFVEAAVQAERLGFDVVHAADHAGSDHSPLLRLAAAAHATERIRLGTYVLNASLNNPVVLAREIVTLDHLSGGRVQLGLGAGHTPAEFAACGVPMAPAGERKARLADFVEILRVLLDGGTVDHHSEHFHLTAATNTTAALQPRLPILVGGSGERLLAHAGRHADIVGLTGLGRTLPDGHRHAARFGADVVDDEVAIVRAAAQDRSDGVEPEIDVLMQVVDITDDRASAARRLAEEVEDLSVDDALVTPFLALGAHDEIADQLLAARERWGITSYVVRDAGDFAPVINRLRAA